MVGLIITGISLLFILIFYGYFGEYINEIIIEFLQKIRFVFCVDKTVYILIVWLILNLIAKGIYSLYFKKDK